MVSKGDDPRITFTVEDLMARDPVRNICGNCDAFVFVNDLPDGGKAGECHGGLPTVLMFHQMMTGSALDPVSRQPMIREVPLGAWPPVKAAFWCRAFQPNEELAAQLEVELLERTKSAIPNPSPAVDEMLATARANVAKLKLQNDPVQGSS